MERVVALSLLAVTSIGNVLPVAAETSISEPKATLKQVDYVTAKPILETNTRFGTKDTQTVTTIPFEQEIIEDNELEYGKEIIEREGTNGQVIKHFQITYWDGKEVERKLTKTEKIPPTNETIRRGTKNVWHLYNTPEQGRVSYWAKLENVWATSYDGNCVGCRGLTYSGTKVTKGVCAVDPNLIPLGTNIYIPDYGFCRAEDIGGGIKGHRIDLGFENVANGSWSARYTNVYLLTKP